VQKLMPVPDLCHGVYSGCVSESEVGPITGEVMIVVLCEGIDGWPEVHPAAETPP